MHENNYNVTASQFPRIVNLEVFRGQCPCRCRHCPVGLIDPRTREAQFGLGGVELDLLRKIVVEIAEHPRSVLRLHAIGEPLLWPHLAEALTIVRNVDIVSWLFTSAVTKDRSLLNDVCNTIRIIEVSVNSTNREDYMISKGCDGFDLVVANLRFMHKMISSQSGTRLVVSRVESEDKAANEEFVKYWRSTGLVHDAFVRTRHTYNGLIPDLQYCGGEQQQTLGHSPCLVHWGRFNISRTGLVVVCFNELFKPTVDSSLVYGNVNEDSIATVWRGEKLQAVREAELTGDYRNALVPVTLPCRNCDRCQPLFGRSGVHTSEWQIENLEEP